MARQKKMPSTLVNMIIVLVIVSGLSALILGFVHQITLNPIKQAQNAKELEAITDVIYTEFDNNPFEEKTIITTQDNRYKLKLYPARKDGKITSVAIKTFSNKAFGGRMELIVGFFLDGTISGYKVIRHSETPGLGSKVNDSKFHDQFQGINPGKNLFKVKQDGGEIDAITAATISSRAVIDAIQRAFNAYSKFNTGN